MPDKNGHLLPEEIKYLSFEGGGGKGAAYLGVLIAFLRPEFNIFKKGSDGLTYLNDSILGIAGSSAGAMTAGLLGAGVPLEELFAMILDIMPSRDPYIYSLEYKNKPVLASFMDVDINQRKAIIPNFFYKNGFVERDPGLSLEAIKALLIVPNPLPIFNAIKTALQVYLRMNNVNEIQIVNGFDRIFNDDGLLPGVIMYRHLNYLVNKYNPSKTTFKGYNTIAAQDNTSTNLSNMQLPESLDKPPGMTFEDIYNTYNKRKIIITGTNISRSQVTYFNRENTPNFSIVAAARISASIPVLFKPIKITHEEVRLANFSENEQRILIGTWGDGGVINNHPFHSFDIGGRINPNILPIVLGNKNINMYQQTNIKAKSPIYGVVNQMKTVLLDIMTENSTEAQYRTQAERNVTLRVPTEIGKYKLETEVFDADRETVLRVGNEAVVETLKYFGWGIEKHPALDIDNIQVGDVMKGILKRFKDLIPQISLQ